MPGEADVADDDAGEVAVDPLQRLLGAADADAGDVLQLQRLLAAEQDMRIVFDDQDGKRLVHRAGLAVGESGTRDEAQLEGGSAAFGVLHAEAAAGGGGQAGREGQAEAQAMFAGLGGEEGFEQVDARRRRIPGPLSRTRRT